MLQIPDIYKDKNKGNNLFKVGTDKSFLDRAQKAQIME